MLRPVHKHASSPSHWPTTLASLSHATSSSLPVKLISAIVVTDGAHSIYFYLLQALSSNTIESAPFDVFVFCGHGLSSSFPATTVASALRDAALPLPHAALLACHQAFLQELASLSEDEQAKSGLIRETFKTPRSLLDIEPGLQHHAVLATVHLFLVQLLRYLASIYPSFEDTEGGSALQGPSEVVGVSTSLFAATVIASSNDVPSFFANAAAALQSTFWLGLRWHYFMSSIPSCRARDDSSWVLAVTGSSREEVEAALDTYRHTRRNANLNLIPVFNDLRVLISGSLQTVRELQASYLPSTATSSELSVTGTLYNTSALDQVKADVLADIDRRRVCFPSHQDLKCRVWSIFGGTLIDLAHHGGTGALVHSLLDIIMVHIVDLDCVTDALVSEVLSHPTRPCRLLNLGPSTDLWRTIAQSLQSSRITSEDWSFSRASASSCAPPQIVRDAPFHREPIAIIGMAVNLPGAEGVSALWELLENGLNTATEIPAHRFDVSQYAALAGGSTRKLKSCFGNFLDNADAFDNTFFHISPREARSMDPQQRLLLQVAYHALEDAGYVPHASPCFNPDTFGTFMGAATNDYVQNLRDEVDVYYSTGTIQAFLSGKLSYAFGFSGPSIVVDTACSSSIVALHQACRALSNGDCNAAIAGGVNVISSPDMHVGLDRGHFLSPTGQCRPWDASADGYCRAEGCGVFVLKRLSDALAEQDRIWGVIRAVEINQSAKAQSITYPHTPTQIHLFKKLLSTAGIHPNQVNLVEAHGTGTQAGDPTELDSIRSVFAVDRSPDNLLHVTSVKANIGHAEAASGAASLAKVLLMMRKRTIPPNISLKRLNPKIRELSGDNIRIDVSAVPWTASRSGDRRLALLNNFGAAGSNAALILEEPPLSYNADASDVLPVFVVGLSCKTEAAAAQMRVAYLRQIDAQTSNLSSLADFAYTATARRQLYQYRISASGSTKEELCAHLRTARVVDVNRVEGKVVFLFSGQGGQYEGMGSGLYRNIPFFRVLVNQCHEKLVSWGFAGVLDVINPQTHDPHASNEAYQSGIFVLEYALASLWKSWGIQPDVVAGHSLGEYVAMVVANVLRLDDALRLVAARARLIDDKCERQTTGMLAVRRRPSELSIVLKTEKYRGLSIACYNSDVDCVLGGNIQQLDALCLEFKDAGFKCLRLNVSHAYHTCAMYPILGELRQLAGQFGLEAPSMPILSNVHGRVVSAGDSSVFTADYFVRQCAEPVHFAQSVRDLFAREELSSVAAWLDIGPQPTTLSMIPESSQRDVRIPCLRKAVPDLDVLASALSCLYSTSLAPDWRKVFAVISPKAAVCEIPVYPFADTRFWVPYREHASGMPTSARPAVPCFSLLGRRASTGLRDRAAFETEDRTLSHLITGHRIAGYALCPASVFLELALSATHVLMERLGRMDTGVVGLSDVVYTSPLVYNSTLRRTVLVSVVLDGDGDGDGTCGTFSIRSIVNASSGEQTHCHGTFRMRSTEDVLTELSVNKSTMERRREHMCLLSSEFELFRAHTVYNVIFPRVVEYSKAYRTIQSIWTDPNGVDAYAHVKLNSDTPSGCFVVHPIFVDSLLHVAGFVVNCTAAPHEIFICHQVDSVHLIPSKIDESATYGIYCSIGFSSETVAIADVFAISPDGTVVAHMKRLQFRKLKMSTFGSALSVATQSPNGTHASHSRHSSGQSTAVSDTSMTDRERTLLLVVSEICGIAIHDLSVKSRLSDLGIDSLMSIELVARLRDLMPDVRMDTHKILSSVDIRELLFNMQDTPKSPASNASFTSDTSSERSWRPADPGTDLMTTLKEVVRDMHADIVTPSSPDSFQHRPSMPEIVGSLTPDCNPTQYQHGGGSSALPLFLIHDGSGLAHSYSQLHPLGCSVWGIHNPRFLTGEIWDGGVPEMAAHYAQVIKNLCDDRGCIVGGWSFGGVVALETSRQLVRAGVNVAGLLLVDSPDPLTRCALAEDVIDSVFNGPDRTREMLRTQMRYSTHALVDYHPSQSSADEAGLPAVMLRSKDAYPLQTIQGEAARFLAHRSDPATSVFGWEMVLGRRVPIFDIPGHHFEAFSPQNIDTLSAKMREALEVLGNSVC